jgi:hypothetical protein
MFTIETALVVNRALPALVHGARKLIAVGVIAAAALSYSTASFAYTAEQQSACMGDAFRVCGEHIPNVTAITACMKKNFSRLSPGCKAQFK